MPEIKRQEAMPIGQNPSSRLMKEQLEALEIQVERELARRRRAEDRVLQLQEQLQDTRLRLRQLERQLKVKEKREAELLSMRRLFDYFRLLWMALVRLDQLHAYEEGLSDREQMNLIHQASWLVSSLIWLPIILWIGLPWRTGFLPMPPLLGGVLLACLAGIWLVTGLLGHMNNALAAFAAVMPAAVLILCVLVIGTGLIQFGSLNLHVLLNLSVGVLVCALLGLTAASILDLEVAETLAAINSVVTGAAIIILLFELGANANIVVMIVGPVFLLSAVTQDRNKKIRKSK